MNFNIQDINNNVYLENTPNDIINDEAGIIFNPLEKDINREPSIAYNNFYELNKDYLDNYIEKLVCNGYNKKSAKEKLKKIYKNKFYILSKR